ncbi:hypothetical protein KKC13_09405 [bacterium]|nr:hypothetical protein [bacterium]MBU1957836.1 hypothetical protein [bacterium]
MVRFVRLLFLSISCLFSSLMAVDSPLIEPEVAVKKIGNNAVQFIMAEKDSMAIIGSQYITIQKLYEGDILGSLPCGPLYICPKEIQNYLQSQGIKKDQELILYDDHYGIYATTLYTVLESIGHKNMKILNGGLVSIENLDPNKRIYDRYYTELMEISSLIQKEDNATSMEKFATKTVDLNKKLSVLKPFLLVQEMKNIQTQKEKSMYKVEKNRLNFTYLVDRQDLLKAVEKVRKEGKESNISIIDACSMMDIVGNKYGNYIPGVNSVNWNDIIDREERGFKSNELLEKIFTKAGLHKENDNYVYCMAGAPKAFYVLLALRSVGYSKVKAFTGDWNVWTGDIIEH